MTMQPETRKCSAIRCAVQIKRSLLMCAAHWNQLPAAQQAEVYRSLREWNAGGSQRPYMLAVCRAQLLIVEAEGLPYTASIKDKISALESRSAQ